MKILVSACLLGVRCRYDGKSKPHPAVERLMEQHTLIPVCGEILGGLPTPRVSAERQGARVVTADGCDVTAAYRRGAEEVLRLAERYGCKAALLKEKSPSCGSGLIYDGSFTGTLVPGDGVAAQLLKEEGLIVFGESDTELLITVLQD